MNREPTSYAANTLICVGVLYYAVRLSAAGRTAVDWAVLTIVAGLILWNLAQLTRLLHRARGTGDVWHLVRTVSLATVGIFNTVLIRAQDAGGWKNWLGYLCLTVAAFDIFLLHRKEQSACRNPGDASQELQSSEEAAGSA